MKIAIITPAFPPEITGSGNLYHDLACDLVKNGHEVTVIAPIPRQRMGDQAEAIRERYGRRLFVREKIDGFTVIRTAVFPLPLSNPIAKGLDHFSVALSQWIGGQLAKKTDVILSYSPPLTFGLSASYLAKQYKIPFVFNVQDIFPQYAVDAGLMNNKTVIKLFEKLERYLYKCADQIIVHSQGNKEYLSENRGVPLSKLWVVHNWADIDRIVPGSRINSFRDEYQLNNAFIVSYAGTMGWAQNLDTVIESANILMGFEDIIFLLVGDGPCRQELEQKAQSLGLKNVRFLPLQKRERYNLLLQTSDACIISLNPGLSTPVVPGKLMDIMSAGRPVVGCVPLKGDAPRIVQEAQCGFCVESNNGKDFAEAILNLYKNSHLVENLGQNGRIYVEKHFSRAVCTSGFEDVLKQSINMKKEA